MDCYLPSALKQRLPAVEVLIQYPASPGVQFLPVMTYKSRHWKEIWLEEEGEITVQ